MGRPTSVTLIAIFGIIIASFGLLFTPVGWAMQFMHFGPPNPALDALKAEPLYLFMIFGFGAIKLVLNGVLMAGSIGSWRLRPWARKTMIGYAWADLILLVISTIISFAYILPKTMEATFASTSMPAPLPPAMRTTMQVITGISAIVGFIFAAALPVCILIFYKRARVIDAFNGIFPPGQGFEVGAPEFRA